MLEGITAGFIISVALLPGTVWLVNVSLSGTRRQTFATGLGFILSQFFWLLVAIPGLMMMCRYLAFLRAGMHFFAAFVLVYMAIRFARSRRVESLKKAEELPSVSILFRNAFNRAFAMPMRLPMIVAVLLTTGVYINHPPVWKTVPDIMLGGLIGLMWWWGQIALLATLFVRRVPESITLRSLNRIRPFCTTLFCFLGLIAILLI